MLSQTVGELLEQVRARRPMVHNITNLVVMNITDDQASYVKSIANTLAAEGIRVETDLRNEKLSLKIRESVVKKIPYMVIAGKKEMESNTLTVRVRDGGELKDIGLQDFLSRVKDENITRR